jgi:hypothetical protein
LVFDNASYVKTINSDIMPYSMVFNPLQVNNKRLMAEKTRIHAHRVAYRNYDDDSYSLNDPGITGKVHYRYFSDFSTFCFPALDTPDRGRIIKSKEESSLKIALKCTYGTAKKLTTNKNVAVGARDSEYALHERNLKSFPDIC